MRDRRYDYLSRAIINHIDHTPITDPVSQAARQRSGEAFDVVVPAWVVLKLPEAASQFARERLIRFVEKRLRFGREDDLKHPTAPCASSRPCPPESLSRRRQRAER